MDKGFIPYKLFDNYEKEIKNEYLQKEPMGIEGVDNFMERNKNLNIIIRTLDELSFRILNFILYSHLFYSNLLGNLIDKDLKSFCQNIPIIKIIKKDWEIIEEILNEKKLIILNVL